MQKIVLLVLAIVSFLIGLFFCEIFFAKSVLIAFAFILIVLSYLLNRQWLGHLPTTDDEEFLQLFKRHFNIADQSVIKERHRIAKALNVPYNKISPLDRFDKFSNHLNFYGYYDVALNDIEQEMIELYESVGNDKKYSLPETIGELISDIVVVQKPD